MDKIIVSFVVTILFVTALRYEVNVRNKRDKRKSIRELMMIISVSILWLYGSIFIYAYLKNVTYGLSCVIVGAVLVLFLVSHQIVKIYMYIYSDRGIKKRELIIKYAYMFLYITLAYTFINITLYLFNHNSFEFIVKRSGNFGCITDVIVTFMYYTVATVTALGYGDIVPITSIAKIFVAVQNLTSFLSVSVLLSLIMVENRRVMQRNEKERKIVSEVKRGNEENKYSSLAEGIEKTRKTQA